MTINDAYTLCQTIYNKFQNGNISPAQFNNAAPICQLSVINQMIGNEQEYQPPAHSARGALPAIPVARYGYGINQKIVEDLRPLITSSTVSLTSGVGTYPTTSLYLDTVTESSGTIVRPVEPDEARILNQSVIKPPIVGESIYYIMGSSVYVFPTSITSVNITYVNTPTPPYWNYTGTTNPVYNPTGSQDFQVGIMLHLRIVAKMLQFFGINLGLDDVAQFSIGLEQKGA